MVICIYLEFTRLGMGPVNFFYSQAKAVKFNAILMSIKMILNPNLSLMAIHIFSLLKSYRIKNYRRNLLIDRILVCVSILVISSENSSLFPLQWM
jgi:hypothetical protein